MNRLTLYARQQQARLEQQSEVVRHAGRRNGYCLQMLVAGFLVECFGNEQKLLYPPDFFLLVKTPILIYTLSRSGESLIS